MKTRMLTLFPLIALTAVGCGKKVTVTMVDPAEVGLPDDVQTVLVINNTAPQSAREADALSREGHATGERRRTDHRGSEVAVESLVSSLQTSSEYRVLSFNVDGSARSVPTLANGEPDWRAIERLCRNDRCDAVIALQDFDSDIYTELERDEMRGEPRHEADFDAKRTVEASATFATYDVASRTVVDEDRLHGTDRSTSYNKATADHAVAELDDTEAMVAEIAGRMGADYAGRVADLPIDVQRKLYSAGDDLLKRGAKKAVAGNWKRAITLWDKAVDRGDRTTKGKALYNLAVAYEVKGDLAKAAQLARRADNLLDRRRTRNTLASLEFRLDVEGPLVADAG